MTVKALVIARKGVKQLLRNKRQFMFAIVFPIVIMFVFRLAMGGTGGDDTTTYDIVVVDLDTGEGPWDDADPPWLAYVNANSTQPITAEELFTREVLANHTTGGEFVVEEILKEATYQDGKPMFDVSVVETVDEGWEIVSDRDAMALVVIPANLSSSLQGIVDMAVLDEVRAHGMTMNQSLPDYGNATLELSGELSSFHYSFAASLVDGTVAAYTDYLYHTMRGFVGEELPGGPVSEEAGSVGARWASIEKLEELSEFDKSVPAVIVFGLMMQTMGVTATLGLELKDRTLNRLKLTKMSSFDLMAGTTIRWMVLGVFQVLVFFAVALLLGVQLGGPLFTTLAGAMVIAMIVVLATISLGLIVSAFVDDPEQATQLSVVIIMPMAFFTGVFFPIDVPAVQALPWAQGAEGLKQMMLYASWSDAMVHAGWTLVGAVILFAVGVYVYSRRRLRSS